MEALQQVRTLTEDLNTQLQAATQALEDREAQLAKGWQKLEEEKQKMAGFIERSATDILEINVGGEVMMMQRGTFTLAEGTILEAIFSGRWEHSLKRDAAGRVFLDFNPTLFKGLLSFLRASRDAKPGKSVAPPVMPPECKDEWDAMVCYLDLSGFLGRAPSPLDLSCPVDALVCPADALVCARSEGGTQDGSIQCDGGVLRAGAPAGTGLRCAVGGARLLGENGSREKAAWRVTVRALPPNTNVLIGVIGNASPADKSYSDPSCWAWHSDAFVTLAGANKPQHGGWNGWKQGDVAVVQLDVASGLRMFLRRSGQVYHIMQGVSADMAKQARLWFIFVGAGTEIEVSQVTAEDLAEAGF